METTEQEVVSTTALIEIKEEATETTAPLVVKAERCAVRNATEAEEASEFVKDVNEALKKIENKRLEFTKPLNQSLKAINETFNELKAPLSLAKDTVTNKIMLWRREEQARVLRQQQEAEKIRKEQEKAGEPVAPAPVIKEAPKNVGSLRVRKVWTFDVEDFSKVPDNYKTLDRAEVANAIRGGLTTIPGLKIYQKESAAVYQ